jgi:hypothetical protein
VAAVKVLARDFHFLLPEYLAISVSNCSRRITFSFYDIIPLPFLSGSNEYKLDGVGFRFGSFLPLLHFFLNLPQFVPQASPTLPDLL